MTFRDISISYEGNKNPELKNLQVSQPPADSRLLPCWGWYARNVQNMVLENVELNYRGEDVRPAFWLNNVGKTELIQVNYTGSKNVGAKCRKIRGRLLKDNVNREDITIRIFS